MNQLSLFAQSHLAQPAPYVAAETSRAASLAIRPDASRLRQAVYAFLKGRGSAGATDVEIQQSLQLTGDTQRPRRWELQRAGLVIDSGERRKTPSGREAIVWVCRDIPPSG